MSSNASKSHHVVRKRFGSTSTCASSKTSSEPLPMTYTNHYGLTWVGSKRDVSDRLGSVRHIMIGESRQLSANNTTIEATIEEQSWSKLYEKWSELEVYCKWHWLRVPKAHSAELPREESTNVLARLERENNQMQRRLDHFHTIQKVRKHLKGKAQERVIKSINEITNLDDDKDISDFSNLSNDNF